MEAVTDDEAVGSSWGESLGALLKEVQVKKKKSRKNKNGLKPGQVLPLSAVR